MPNSPVLTQENEAPSLGHVLAPSLPQLTPNISSEYSEVSPSSSPAPSAGAVHDFIDSYADYADILEVPRTMHEAVGIQLIGSVLNKNGVMIPHGATPLSLDLWLVLLSGSGAGRSTLTTLARPILDAAQIEDLIRRTQWGSPEALYQDMADNSHGLLVWGEFAEKMKMLKDPRFGGAKEWVTDRYDNFALPDNRTYRKTNKRKSTPPIMFNEAPRINILATSSEVWFFSHLSQDDSAGGFVPRWLIVKTEGPTRDIAIPKQPDSEQVPPLAEALAEIAQLQGEADLSLITSLHEEWYVAAKKRFFDQPNASLAMAYFNRHRAHILKLAVIFEASRSRTLRVSPESWARAVTFAKSLEETIFSLLGTGMNEEGYALKQMEDKIRKAGPKGIKLSDLTRSFQSVKIMDRRNRLETLVESALVKEIVQESKTGRPPKTYIHSQYLRQTKSVLDELNGTRQL